MSSSAAPISTSSSTPTPARDLELVWACDPEWSSCIDSFWPMHPATTLLYLFGARSCYSCSARARPFLADCTPGLVPTVLNHFELVVLENSRLRHWVEPGALEAAVTSFVDGHEFCWAGDERRTELVEWLRRARAHASGEVQVDDIVDLGDFPVDIAPCGSTEMAFVTCLAVSTLVADESAWIDEVVRVLGPQTGESLGPRAVPRS